MSKSDRDLDEIDLDPIFNRPRKPKWRDDKSIYGLDTETYEGKLFTLSKAGPNNSKTLSDLDQISSIETWKFLTTRKLEGGINVFYNLKFDAEVLLRNLLDESEIERLALFNEARISKNWKILYIPGKILSFSQGKEIDGYFKRKRTWSFFDASQFFYGSLEDASQEWLNEGKADEDLDVKLFNSPGYRLRKQDKIKNYCEQDADLVRRLFDKFSKTAENMDLPAGWPVSTGAMAEQFYRVEMDQKIKYPNKTVASMGWDSYHGGRFEVVQRGWVGQTETYDINSAYPYHASELPDPYDLDWYKSKNVDDFRSGDYGFIRAEISTSQAPIQPFAYKSSELDKLIFPRLINTEVTVPQQTFIYALDQGLINDYTILEGYTTRPAKNPRKPFEKIKQLYRKRKEYEAEGRDKLGKVIKMIINSIYGKTSQITKQVNEVEGDHQLADNEELFPADFLPNRVKGKFSTIVKEFSAGRWFNPIIATYITALTRLQLLKFIYDNGLEYKTVMLATDSLMFEKPNNLEIETTEKLGGWDKESEGATYIIGAGVYEIWPGDDKPKNLVKDRDADYKTKARGFAKYEHEGESILADSLKMNGDKTASLAVQQDRPISSAEALWSARDFSSIADFNNSFRAISPNMDDKRDWSNPVSFTDLTGGSQTSTYREVIDGILAGEEKENQMEGEYIKSRADEIYDRIKETGGVYITDKSDVFTEWKEDISFGKRMQLKTEAESLTLDHWTDKFDLTTSELLKKLADATPEDQRKTELEQRRLRHFMDSQRKGTAESL